MIQELPPIEEGVEPEKPEEVAPEEPEEKPEEVETAPKRRGRPPGAKNKAKPPAPPAAPKPKPAAPKPAPEPEPEDSDVDVDAAVGFFATHLGNLQRRTLDAKRDQWRNLFR